MQLVCSGITKVNDLIVSPYRLSDFLDRKVYNDIYMIRTTTSANVGSSCANERQRNTSTRVSTVSAVNRTESAPAQDSDTTQSYEPLNYYSPVQSQTPTTPRVTNTTADVETPRAYELAAYTLPSTCLGQISDTTDHVYAVLEEPINWLVVYMFNTLASVDFIGLISVLGMDVIKSVCIFPSSNRWLNCIFCVGVYKLHNGLIRKFIVKVQNYWIMQYTMSCNNIIIGINCWNTGWEIMTSCQCIRILETLLFTFFNNNRMCRILHPVIPIIMCHTHAHMHGCHGAPPLHACPSHSSSCE